jgi:hypothetical protein
MDSSADQSIPAKSPAPSRRRNALERWNRKLHYYSGLFLLFFVWLFAFTGLLLNHSSWTIDYWKNRKETTYQRPITPPASDLQGDLAQAHDLMRQLKIDGEILWTVARNDPNQFEFQVRRPGSFYFIKINFAQKRADIREAHINAWGIMRFLHVFSGVQIDDPRNRRDWPMTFVWAYSMDAVAAGLIFMVLSSIYMWLELPQKRRLGAIVLAFGTIVCAVFCFGLRWIF